MKRTIYTTPIIGKLFRLTSILLLKLFRWKLTGNVPTAKKYVIIAAPHTSNWDFFFSILAAAANKIEFHWMGKDTIFKKPFGSFMRWMGGVPIDRSKNNNIVQSTVDIFNERESFVITIPPEGSRARVRSWKTGFYFIARGAGVPVQLAYLDYSKREFGLGPLFKLTDDIEKDMSFIRDFYKDVKGKRDLFTEASLVTNAKNLKLKKAV